MRPPLSLYQGTSTGPKGGRIRGQSYPLPKPSTAALVLVVILDAFLAMLVVYFPLLFILKDFVRFVDVVELYNGIVVIGIFVWVIFNGLFSIGLLDLTDGGVFIDAQYLVEIPPVGHDNHYSKGSL